MTKGRPQLDRRALFSSAAAAALLAATGVSAAGAPRQGGRFRVALSGAMRSDSWAQGDGLFMQVARQGLIFDTLTELAADGTLRGDLAVDWRSDALGHVWQFDLRPDVLFHDGARVTARDVAFSLRSALGSGAVITERGKDRLEITLDEPDAGLPLRLSAPEFIIRPAHAPMAGIGTGLYQLRHFAAGQQVIATRVASHYKDGQAGWFDEVELVSIPSPQVRVQALEEFLVDAADLPVGHKSCDRGLMVAKGCAANRDLAHPAQIGTQRSMDNLRAAERWWFG